MESLFLSLVIPTYNRPAELAECLAALHPQIAGHSRVEALVLDDGKTHSETEFLCAKFPWVQHHIGPRRGPAANRNRGASLARGSWVIFLDDDCMPKSEFLFSYLSVMREGIDHEREVLVGPTFNPGNRPSLLWEAPQNRTGEAIISCNFAITRNFFDQLNGFDERFPGAAFEDTDFEIRARSAGAQVKFVSGAAVDHPFRRIPNAWKLACRWEARVISTLDLGAPPREILWRLPVHVLKVILSRFRGRPWAFATAAAGLIFAGEFAWVLWLVPRWLWRHVSGPRSSFWERQVSAGRAPARFGL